MIISRQKFLASVGATLLLILVANMAKAAIANQSLPNLDFVRILHIKKLIRSSRKHPLQILARE